MAIRSSDQWSKVRWWWLACTMAQIHFPAEAMAVIEYEPDISRSSDGLIFGLGVMAAVFVNFTFPELLSKHAPNLNALLKWGFRVGVALIALELILSRFGVQVYTREQGLTLTWLWAIGRIGLALYICGVADSRDK